MFNQSEYNVNENETARPVLVLSRPSSTDITVLVKDVSRSAMSKWTYVSINNRVHSNLTGNDDYIGGLYSVTFSAEVTSIPFDVSIIDDAIVEGNEKFNLVIVPGSLPKSVTRSSPGKATVIIVDDDSSK